MGLYYQSALKSILREKILLKEDPAKKKIKSAQEPSGSQGERGDQGRRNHLARSATNVATRLRANGVHEYDIEDLLGHIQSVTGTYDRSTPEALEDAVNRLAQPRGNVIKFKRKAG